MKRLVYALFLMVSLSLTSCIDILDEIVLNEDKSGSVFIGLESRMLGTLMRSAREQIDPAIMEQLDSFPSMAADKLKGIKGIHEIDALDVISQGRFGIAFKFDSPKALNKAYYALMDMDKKFYHPKIVKIGKHKISLRNITPQLVEQIKNNSPELINSDFIKYLNIRTVLRLPASSISVESDKKANTREANRVLIKYPLDELVRQGESTAYKVRF
jgi:hypothetical protein